MSPVATVDHSLKEDGDEPVWELKMIVGDRERLKLDGVSFSSVQKAFNNINLKRHDAGRVELTARRGSRVLATNMEQVASSNDSMKKVWESECKKSVNPIFNLATSKIIEKDGRKYAQINLDLCDFVGGRLIPTVSVQSQALSETKYNVVYKCQFDIEHIYSSEMRQNADILCEYGYTTFPGETSPEIIVPVEYAPGSEFYEAHRLKMTEFDLTKFGNGRRYELITNYDDLPFGSHAGCNQQKVDLFYAEDGIVRQTRVNYKRHHKANGDIVWVLENAAELPNFDNVVEYYDGAGENSRKVTIYRFCEWSPATLSNVSGNTLKL
jgi:hypothetical protein